ncbi:MAG: hypothetical protein WCE82_00800 [Halobacteriota archaeon]
MICEPTRVSHGTSIDEFRQVLTTAGLREWESTTTRSMQWTVYKGIFEKADAP